MSKKIISVCANTIKHFRNIMKNTNSQYINIGVKGGGCNGFKYYVEPTNKEPEKLDEKLVIDGVNINICGSSVFHLLGTEIKWKENYMGVGLEFENPNATSKCGCGETFSI